MRARVEGTGPPVLLLHGIPTSGRLWDEVVAALRGRLTCVVVDLPGAGESEPLEIGATPARYAEELEALRERLGIHTWHVVGHDAGCVIAVQYAATSASRVRRLVLCSPPVFPEHRVAWFFRALRSPMLGAWLAPLLTTPLFVAMWWRLGRRDLASARIVAAFYRPFRGLSGAKRFRALLRWGEPSDILAATARLLPQITAATLVVHGRRERIIPRSFALRASAAIPGSRLALLECGHFQPLECPQALSTLLLTFLTAEATVEATKVESWSTARGARSSVE